MNCREMTEFLLDYESGELPSDVRAHFEEHLRRCPECVCYMRSYQATVRACHEAAAPADLPPLPDGLVRAILAARARLGGRPSSR